MVVVSRRISACRSRRISACLSRKDIREKFLRQIFKIYFSNFFERETITLRFFPVFLLNLCEFAVRIEIEDMKNTRGEVWGRFLYRNQVRKIWTRNSFKNSLCQAHIMHKLLLNLTRKRMCKLELRFCKLMFCQWVSSSSKSLIQFRAMNKM
jgi:hypothetical protein